jgi:hypothetical protein
MGARRGDLHSIHARGAGVVRPRLFRGIYSSARTGSSTTRWGMMTSSAEDCWRLSAECGRWAAECRDSAARIAFRQMATAWSRLAFSEDFASPADERIVSASFESSEPIPAAKAAPSPVVLSEAEVDDVGKYDHTGRAGTEKISDFSRQQERLSLPSPTRFPLR